MKGTAQFEDFSVSCLSDVLPFFCSQYTRSRFLLDFFSSALMAGYSISIIAQKCDYDSH